MSPYEKLCVCLLGEVPLNERGRTKAGSKTAKDLAEALGYRRQSLLAWYVIPETNIRIIPAGVARRIELATQGAVTAEEIREFARRHKSGSAA